MLKLWENLTSEERLDAILRALDEKDRALSAAQVAHAVAQRHPMKLPTWGKNGHGNGLRRPSLAVRVTPGIIRLRERGLIVMTVRPDGRSGTADVITDAGRAYLRR